MKFTSHALPRFWTLYDKLPPEIREQADKQYALFVQNPFHSSLHLKPVGAFWSARISRSYRAIAIREGTDFFWFWIGSHDQYQRLVSGTK